MHRGLRFASPVPLIQTKHNRRRSSATTKLHTIMHAQQFVSDPAVMTFSFTLYVPPLMLFPRVRMVHAIPPSVYTLYNIPWRLGGLQGWYWDTNMICGYSANRDQYSLTRAGFWGSELVFNTRPYTGLKITFRGMCRMSYIKTMGWSGKPRKLRMEQVTQSSKILRWSRRFRA